MHHVGDCNAMFRAGSALLFPEDALVVRQKAQHRLIDHLYLHLHARVTVGWLRAAEAPNRADVRLVVDVRLKSLCTLVLSYSRIDDTSART